jgi:uncharacterized membrane protein HdeD (DUF308 family)
MTTMNMMFEERALVEEAAERWWLFLMTGIGWLVFGWFVLQWDYSFKEKTILLVACVGISGITRGITEVMLAFKLRGLRRGRA